MPTPADAPRMAWWPTLGWAAYLACSWTWCIGMFLPILLVRDFGPWSFLVFAAPNALGAAAMGWILSREASRDLVVRHATAVTLFSVITCIFQAAFAAIVFAMPQPGFTFAGVERALVLASILPLGAAALLLFLRRERSAGGLGMLGSTVAAVVLLASGAGAASLAAVADTPGALPTSHLAALAPVCILGFVLCPYLDPTFHLARLAQGDRAARASFSIGFGVLFLGMIVLTLAYAAPVLAGGPLAPAVAAGHIVPQLAFTFAAHLIALKRLGGARVQYRALWLIVLAGAGLAVYLLGSPAPVRAMPAGEFVYRLFMAFYGLVFPAYVLICVVPIRGQAGVSRQTLRAWALAVGVAAPMYWMGFIERQTWWLMPGVAVVLLARWFAAHTATAEAAPR